MSLRKIWMSAALCLVAAMCLMAQNRPDKVGTARFGDPTGTARKYENYLYGVIKTIDSNHMVLEKTKYGIDQVFKFHPKTKFFHDNKPSSLQDLKVGDEVWVDPAKEKKTGELYARRVVTGIVVPVE